MDLATLMAAILLTVDKIDSAKFALSIQKFVSTVLPQKNVAELWNSVAVAFNGSSTEKLSAALKKSGTEEEALSTLERVELCLKIMEKLIVISRVKALEKMVKDESLLRIEARTRKEVDELIPRFDGESTRLLKRITSLPGNRVTVPMWLDMRIKMSS